MGAAAWLAVIIVVSFVTATLLSLASTRSAWGTTESERPLLQFVSKETLPSLENTTLKQGESVTVPIMAVPASGYEIQAVNLEVQDVPRNAYAWIDWSTYPTFDNQDNDHTIVVDYQLKVYVDSNAEPGEYALKIVGTNGVAKNTATSEDIQITNATFGMLHLTITPSDSRIRMDIGDPEYQSKQLCVEDDSSPGDGTMCIEFVAVEEFPVAIFSSSGSSETISMSASGVPEGVWVKFVPANLSITNNSHDKEASASGKLKLAGAVRPFVGFPPDTTVPIIQAGDATDFLPIVKTLNMTILHAAEKIDFPGEVTQNINGTNFGYAGVVYDPRDGNSSSLPVSLSIAGMASEDGSKDISSLPEWIRADIPSPSFTLNSTEPYYFLVKITTHQAPVGTYYLAIDEQVGDKNFTGYLKIDVIPPIYFAPALPPPSPPPADDRFVAFTEVKDARINFEMLGPIKFDIPNQAFPYIANGIDYTINVTFFRPDVMAAMKDVKYNVLILNENGEEVFNAAKQNGTDSLYSADGKATMRYNFAETGGAGVRAVFLGQGSQTVEPQNADFVFQVIDLSEIPEFGSIAALSMAAGIVGIIIMTKKYASL